MHLPRVAVIILNWNGLKFLEDFLPSVSQSTYANLEIILADNASTDGSIDYVRAQFPQISIIQNAVNLGFAEGYNQVLRGVKAKYFVLLNSDVEVTPGWIEPVIQMMEFDSMIAVAQPKILSYSDKRYFEYAGAAGGFIDKFGYSFCRGRLFDSLEEDTGQYNQPTEIFWATGAAFFIKSDVWFESGGLDADFFAHMEEIDLCWRLKNKGYKIMYCPHSSVFHVGGGTLRAESSFKTYLNFRNNLVMLQKNLPGSRIFSIIFIRFWLDLLSIVKFLFQGNLKNALAVSRAHFYFFRNINHNAKKRGANGNWPNHSGLYGSSIVWQYFAKGRKRFSQLNFK